MQPVLPKMGKGRRNQRNADYYKVQGGAVEDRDVGRAAKQKLSRQKATAERSGPAPAKRKPAKARPTRRPAPPKAPPRPPVVEVNPEAHAPNTFVGAALSRLRQGAAGAGVLAIRWAGYVFEVARARAQEAVARRKKR